MACVEHAAGTDWSFEQNVALELPLLPARSPVFELKLKLFQLTLQLLAFRAKDHSLVLLDDQFQMFNLLAGRFYLRLASCCCSSNWLCWATTIFFNASVSSVSRFGNGVEITTAVWHE